MKVELLGMVFDPKQIMAISPIHEDSKLSEDGKVIRFFIVYFKAGMPQKFSTCDPIDALIRVRKSLIELWDKITTSPTGNEKVEILFL